MAVAGWTGLGAVAGTAMMGAGLGMVGEGAGRAVEEDRIQGRTETGIQGCI